MAKFSGTVVKGPAFKPVTHLPLTLTWLLHLYAAPTSKAKPQYWTGTAWSTNIRLAQQFSTKTLAIAAGALIVGTTTNAIQHGLIETL